VRIQLTADVGMNVDSSEITTIINGNTSVRLATVSANYHKNNRTWHFRKRDCCQAGGISNANPSESPTSVNINTEWLG
jgi:hypothetical protein